MAKLSVSVDVPVPPEQAWECASDLSRYKEWLPSIGCGAASCPTPWTRARKSCRSSKSRACPTASSGRSWLAKLKPKGDGSTVTLDVHLGGPALFVSIGMVVAAALKGDIRESLNRFKTVFAPVT